MEYLRRRIPFTAEVEDDDSAVLDEQQQDQMIADLRKEVEEVRKDLRFWLKSFVGLCAALQLCKFVIFPEGTLGTFFALLSLFIHLNLAFYFLEDENRALLRMDRPLPFRMLYYLSGVAPVLSSLLNFHEPWKICWWCITPFVVFAVQSLLEKFQKLDGGLADLEKLKYRAPGA